MANEFHQEDMFLEAFPPFFTLMFEFSFLVFDILIIGFGFSIVFWNILFNTKPLFLLCLHLPIPCHL